MENKHSDNSLEEYHSQRKKFLAEAFALKYGNLQFSENDHKANLIFENIRQKTRQQLPSEFHSKALHCKDKVAPLELFKLIEKMPKGSHHHVHAAFYLPSKWFVESSLNETTFINDAGKIAVFNEIPSQEWKSILKIRENVDDKTAFDKNLEDCFHLTVEEADKPEIWKAFQNKIANRMAICYRKDFWKKYILDLCLYAIQEGFSNIQVKTYVPTGYQTQSQNFMADDEEIQIYRDCQNEARLKDPNFTIGIIFTGFRFWSNDTIKKFLETARVLAERHRDIVIGYDFVAEEKLKDAVEFAPLVLEHARITKSDNVDNIPPLFHGGESLDIQNTNLYDLFLYNSKRIGHGLNLFKHPYLYEKIKQKDICIEVNPISNQILQYVADLRIHPAIGYHNYGIKISLSSDDPGVFQTNTCWDFFAAAVSFEFNLLDFKRAIVNSIETSCMLKEIQESMYKDWQKKWDMFIEKLIEEH